MTTELQCGQTLSFPAWSDYHYEDASGRFVAPAFWQESVVCHRAAGHNGPHLAIRDGKPCAWTLEDDSPKWVVEPDFES